VAAVSNAGYSPPSINLLLRVLFVSTSRADVAALFDLLDGNRSGALDVDEFRNVVYLTGEQLPAEAIERWFEAIDADGSGVIEIAEFRRCAIARGG
jgi:Ca2+-binding EF-hand superfamily protein